MNIPARNLKSQTKLALQSRSHTKTSLIESEYFDTYFESTYGVNWLYLNPSSPRKFTPKLVQNLRRAQEDIKESVLVDMAENIAPSVKYQVFSSSIPGVFNLGGDLDFFVRKIRERDRQGLREYAINCIDTVYTSASNYGLPITTIALVQGTAMGGGLEAALANNIVVAEKGCQMGFPEILFNMFPGMGAYQLLCRRIPPCKAESLILSGKNYDSEELFEMGLIDILTEPGKGEEAVWDFIKSNENRTNGRNAFYKAVSSLSPFNYKDFVEMVDSWVDTAFSLKTADLKTMEFLIRAQRRLEN